MKQEEAKELILKDLSSRLPYGVYCKVDDCSEPVKLVGIKTYDECRYLFGNVWVDPDVNNVLPYLRPMSSLTEEEFIELEETSCNPPRLFRVENIAAFDWLNERHFDYRGLIKKGLALEAPKGMYKL